MVHCMQGIETEHVNKHVSGKETCDNASLFQVKFCGEVSKDNKGKKGVVLSLNDVAANLML